MKNRDSQILMKLYGALGASLVVSLIPHAIFAVLAALLFTGALIAAGRLRKKAEPSGFLAHHLTYFIRTIWLASLFGGVVAALASVYVLGAYDPSPIHDCADALMAGMAGQSDVEGCLSEFISVNKAVFMAGTIMAAVPLLVYLLYRIGAGLLCIRKGRMFSNVKRWL